MIFDNSVVVDIEATGGFPQSARIIEIGVVAFEKGKKVLEWETLVNPKKKIPRFIQNHIGITDEMVEDAPLFRVVSKKLREILDGKLLIAHNVSIDLAYLQREFNFLGLNYSPQVFCSLKLSQKLYPIFRKHGLDSIVDRFDIHTKRRHRALGDVLIVCQLLQQMQKDFSNQYLDSAIKTLMTQLNSNGKKNSLGTLH